jgi:hypothetical protein
MVTDLVQLANHKRAFLNATCIEVVPIKLQQIPLMIETDQAKSAFLALVLNRDAVPQSHCPTTVSCFTKH